MAISMEVVDKYVKTLVEFWALRPRAFLERRKIEPSRYLSPSQFFLASLSILAVLYLATFSFYKDLPVDIIERYPMLKQTGDPKTYVVVLLTAVVLGSLLSSVGVKACAALWPIKGRVTFGRIVDFQFYLMAIILPMGTIDLLAAPILLNYVSESRSPYAVYALYVPFIVGYLAGSILWFVYVLPGLSKLYGVSALRMFAGLTLWGSLIFGGIGFLIGFSIGFYSAVHKEEWQLRNPPEWAFVDNSEAFGFFIGTKTVSLGKDGNVTAVIKMVPRDTEAGKKEKKEMIDDLTSDVGEAKASHFSFELITFEYQCNTKTYIIRSSVDCDHRGNSISTPDNNPDGTPQNPGPFSVVRSELKAACYLAEKASQRSQNH
jgi:hypothetical protein